MSWEIKCWLKSDKNTEKKETICYYRFLATDLLMVTDNKNEVSVIVLTDRIYNTNYAEVRFKRWVFRVWSWQWLWDDTWRLTSTSIRACVRALYPGLRLQQQLRFWLSALIFIVSDSTTISYEPLSQAASVLSRRIYSHGALKLKPAKWGVGGALVGKM